MSWGQASGNRYHSKWSIWGRPQRSWSDWEFEFVYVDISLFDSEWATTIWWESTEPSHLKHLPPKTNLRAPKKSTQRSPKERSNYFWMYRKWPFLWSLSAKPVPVALRTRGKICPGSRQLAHSPSNTPPKITKRNVWARLLSLGWTD
jgi:hypothetical protein